MEDTIEPIYGEDYGECDFCDYTFDVASNTDHCGYCGNCWSHCSCSPKRTEEYAYDGTFDI